MVVNIMKTVQPADFKDYIDDDNNEIIINGNVNTSDALITFYGKNNSVIIGKNTRLERFHLIFHSDNSHFRIGDKSRFIGNIILGSNCSTRIGDNFDCAGRLYITAAEDTSVTIGNDCRFNADIQIRTHDTHPIFDINTHERLNKSKSIHIGNDVWFGNSVNVLKGVWIGNNCVVGLDSTVTKDVRNNCLAVGSPAEIKRENIDWTLAGLTKTPFPNYDD
jgi:acetyltransferase-like isoleucine patch superfamily enzyme